MVVSVEEEGGGGTGAGKGKECGDSGKTREKEGEDGEVEKREGARGGESVKILKRDG